MRMRVVRSFCQCGLETGVALVRREAARLDRDHILAGPDIASGQTQTVLTGQKAGVDMEAARQTFQMLQALVIVHDGVRIALTRGSQFQPGFVVKRAEF